MVQEELDKIIQDLYKIKLEKDQWAFLCDANCVFTPDEESIIKLLKDSKKIRVDAYNNNLNNIYLLYRNNK